MLSQSENGLCYVLDIHDTGIERVGYPKRCGSFHPIELIIGTDEGKSIYALTQVEPRLCRATMV